MGKSDRLKMSKYTERALLFDTNIEGVSITLDSKFRPLQIYKQEQKEDGSYYYKLSLYELRDKDNKEVEITSVYIDNKLTPLTELEKLGIETVVAIDKSYKGRDLEKEFRG